jgi:hypothetical protein
MTDDDHNSGLTVLKRDGRGRVRSTPQQRREALAQFECSGLSGPAFCRLAGIHYQTFVSWRKAARDIKASPAEGLQPVTIRMVEAVSSTALVSVPLQVALCGGAILQLTDASQVFLAAHLLRTLSQTTSSTC